MNRLLVIIPDRVSAILAKGEYQPRYYNPGELFDEVHLLLTNDDTFPVEDLQLTVGRAKLHLHNLPEPTHLSRKPWVWLDRTLLKKWAAHAVELARSIQPNLIRCHGADLNTYAAMHIKKELNIPYVVSLHTNPDALQYRRIHKAHLSKSERKKNELFEYVEREGMKDADLVMPVYQSIIPYVIRMGVKNYRVCYNVLDPAIKVKSDYALHDPARVLSVGRYMTEKNPENLIRAIGKLQNAELTLVGDGPLRSHLEGVVAELQIGEQVTFIPSMANSELGQQLSEFDIFAFHNNAWGIPKTLMEATLAGLPCVINHHADYPIPELSGDFVVRIDDSTDGYASAIDHLIRDGESREKLGQRALEYANDNWLPAKAEKVYADIYQQFN